MQHPVVTAVVEATRKVHETWKRQARFQRITIQGAIARGAPGCLAGPDFEALLRAAVQRRPYQGDDRLLAEAAVRGIAANFNTVIRRVQVPGLLWYPTFIAAPGPVAPPTPNVSCRLSSLIPEGVSGLTNPGYLLQAMKAKVQPIPGRRDSQQPAQHAVLSEIANQVARYFYVWLLNQEVTNVMGTGPVAGFDPPRVMTGPVAGGHVLPGGVHLP